MIKMKKAMGVFFKGFILNTNMSVEVMAQNRSVLQLEYISALL